MRKSLPLIVLLLVGGCGGGGGGAPVAQPPTPIIIDLPLDPARSGFVTSTNLASANVAPGAGDLADNSEQRAILTFPNGGVPPGATLQSVVLRVYQSTVVGNSYTDFPTGLSVDSVDIGAALDVADFGVAALSTPGNLSPADATLGAKTLSVLAELAADRTAGRTASSFRLAFVGAPNVDGAGDRATFGVSAPGTETVLRVTYLP